MKMDVGWEPIIQESGSSKQSWTARPVVLFHVLVIRVFNSDRDSHRMIDPLFTGVGPVLYQPELYEGGFHHKNNIILWSTGPPRATRAPTLPSKLQVLVLN